VPVRGNHTLGTLIARNPHQANCSASFVNVSLALEFGSSESRPYSRSRASASGRPRPALATCSAWRLVESAAANPLALEHMF
jgi:hypothetical protein